MLSKAVCWMLYVKEAIHNVDPNVSAKSSRARFGALREEHCGARQLAISLAATACDAVLQRAAFTHCMYGHYPCALAPVSSPGHARHVPSRDMHATHSTHSTMYTYHM